MQKLIDEKGAENICVCIITITSNGNGGQPVVITVSTSGGKGGSAGSGGGTDLNMNIHVLEGEDGIVDLDQNKTGENGTPGKNGTGKSA